jgi:hypothetical protein
VISVTFSSQHKKFAMPFLDILYVSKRKCVGGSKGYFLLCSVVNTKRTPWWAYGLVAILFVSSFRLSNINSGNGLSPFSPSFTIPCPPKKRKKYRGQKTLFSLRRYHCKFVPFRFLLDH